MELHSPEAGMVDHGTIGLWAAMCSRFSQMCLTVKMGLVFFFFLGLGLGSQSRVRAGAGVGAAFWCSGRFY